MKTRPCIVCLVLGFWLIEGCAGFDTAARKQDRVQAYLSSHPELSQTDRDFIANGKMYIGLPLEAAQAMTGGITGGMLKKDEIVSENGVLKVYFNGWFRLYFRDDRLVMWREATQ